MGNEGKDTYTFYLTNVKFKDDFFKTSGSCKIKIEANPNAPKDIEGSYTLTVNGRTTTLSDGKDTVSVTCHVDDNFDIGEGVRQCFEKLKKTREEIKVGDMVEVINCLHCYDTYPEWLYNRVDFQYIKQYDYAGRMSDGDHAEVIAIGPLSEKYDKTIYAVKSKVNGKVYLFNSQGLRKVKVVD